MTLPETVRDQISKDGLSYGHFGKLGEVSAIEMIDAPDGQAKVDFEEWLETNPQIAQEIEASVKLNKARVC